MYRRSLLVLRALTDRRTGGAVAGAREGWAYVWPRDAGAVAIAFAEAGFRAEARRVAHFLLGLDLEAAARFHATGEPVPAREAQGDAAGWVAAAARAAGLRRRPSPLPWRDRADYQEKEAGEYLGNGIAAARLQAATGTPTPGALTAGPMPGEAKPGVSAIGGSFGTDRGLVRVAGEPDSGLDSAAAWAVRPFRIEALYPAARRTLHRLAAGSGRFGILPSENWDGGVDPWTAPTAWTAWGLAGLAREAAARGDRALAGVDRRAALRLMTALRRAATQAGLLPERVDADTGLPTSTTPLSWSHAFAILALRKLWP